MSCTARGVSATIAAIELRRRLGAAWRIVFDCRADEVAEDLGRGRQRYLTQPADWTPATRAIYQQTFDRERRACDADNTIIVVSNVMSRMLQDRHKAAADRIRVQPWLCGHGTVSAPGPRIREETDSGSQAKLVVAYLGSLEWYQLPEQSLRLFKLIRGLQPDAIFLAITSHPARMRKSHCNCRNR
jgi:hypothetical protein